MSSGPPFISAIWSLKSGTLFSTPYIRTHTARLPVCSCAIFRMAASIMRLCRQSRHPGHRGGRERRRPSRFPRTGARAGGPDERRSSIFTADDKGLAVAAHLFDRS